MTGPEVIARLFARRSAGEVRAWTVDTSAAGIVGVTALVCERTFGRALVTAESSTFEAAMLTLAWKLDELATLAIGEAAP
jgi:hypothetical protein